MECGPGLGGSPGGDPRSRMTWLPGDVRGVRPSRGWHSSTQGIHPLVTEGRAYHRLSYDNREPAPPTLPLACLQAELVTSFTCPDCSRADRLLLRLACPAGRRRP